MGKYDKHSKESIIKSNCMLLLYSFTFKYSTVFHNMTVTVLSQNRTYTQSKMIFFHELLSV
jgi:hypothetical protein